MRFRPLWFFLVGTVIHFSVAKAQQTGEASPAATPGGEDTPSSFQAINATIDTI